MLKSVIAHGQLLIIRVTLLHSWYYNIEEVMWIQYTVVYSVSIVPDTLHAHMHTQHSHKCILVTAYIQL